MTPAPLAIRTEKRRWHSHSGLSQHHFLTAAAVVLLACGCRNSDPSSAKKTDEDSAPQAPKTFALEQKTDSESNPFQAVSIGAIASPTVPKSDEANPAAPDRRQTVLDALKPLQVMLGKWRGTTRKVYNDFKAVDELEWVFDFSGDRDQPVLLMTSDKSPYVREARLAFDTQDERYHLSLTDAEGHRRDLVGDFSIPVKDVAGDGNELQRTYELTFREMTQGDAEDRWQIVLDQQENDRYLMVLSKSRNSDQPFRQFDVVSTQRLGTSIALSDSDYGEKECLISQGLGTISVTYQGRTYWVCCSGCAAAFQEDPEFWIAEAAKRKAAASDDAR